MMRLIIHATPERYRQEILDEANQGRLPLAWLMFGHIEGHGWGFLHPWAQQAVFPGKGKWGADTDPDQTHETFAIVRITSVQAAHKHRNHDYYIEGRYWYGWVWRASWGKRWRFWPCAKWALLDPDIITHDPGRADDWGDRLGENW